MHGLIRAIFAPYLEATTSERLAISGCDFAVRASAITGLALVLHEFATNAAKHGALSTAEGHIHVNCSKDSGALMLQWEEHGGPPIDGVPSHQSLAAPSRIRP